MNWSLSCFVILGLFSFPLMAKKLVDDPVLLKTLIANHRLTSNLEDFYFMEDGTLLYHELDNDIVTNGLWFIKQATFNYDAPSPYKNFKPTRQELAGKPVICIAIDVTSKEEFSWLPCTRLYTDHENLYVAHQTQCNLDEPLENNVIHCNWTSRVFFHYRLNSIEE